MALKALDSLEFVELWTDSGGKAHSFNLARSQETRSADGSGQLSRVDLERRLTRHDDLQLVVTPLLEGNLSDAGIDVRLSSSFIVFKHSATSVFDAIRGERQDPRELQETVEKEWGERFVLHPDELVLAATLEYIVLPLDLVGQLNTRSKYGRLGLLAATAVQIQPGSRGVITLELANLSRTPLALRAGQRIGQIALHTLTTPLAAEDLIGSPTQLCPTGPEFSKVTSDWDNGIVQAIRQTLVKESLPTPSVAE